MKSESVCYAMVEVLTDGSKVTNVSVSGVLLTNFDGELSSLNKAIYDESSTAEITNFTSNITVEKQ